MLSRIEKYNKLSETILYLNNLDINTLTTKPNINNRVSWGETGICKIDSIKVFYKKLPLASKFYTSGINTSNLYNLPAYYNYPFGSAGVNPWRELLTHIKTSNWVISGQIENFPILYHYRIIKDSQKNFNSGLDDKIIEKFCNNAKIKNYLTDRYKCEYKIILFLEYIPNVLYKYIPQNINYIHKYIVDSEKILNFLQSKGILDLDIHLGNFLLDSNNCLYLTDFGLILDKNFDLEDDEKYFFNKNKLIPKYAIFRSIYTFYFFESMKNKIIKDNYSPSLEIKLGKEKFNKLFINTIDEINKLVKIPNFVIQLIKINKSKIFKLSKLKNDFYTLKNKNIIFL